MSVLLGEKRENQDRTKIREILKRPVGKALDLKFVDPDFMKIYREVGMM